ncbi:MAG: TatD family hydrolase [Betaproteobacteria bacterium]
MLIDTHCHLDAAEFAEDRDAVVLAARAVGVSKIIIPAVSPKNFTAVRDCCLRYSLCFPAYGIHPLYLNRVDEDDLVGLKEWLITEAAGLKRPVAVGEIGLDFFEPDFDAARQEHFFIQQLKIAREFDLPVLLHVRRAVDQVLKCLRRIKVRGGIAHAFNGSRQQADEFIRLGFKLGFGGAVSHPGSSRIRSLAASLPINSIVLETDAPDMPPRWLTGGRNEPGELLQLAEVLADLRSESLEQVLKATGENALEIFHLPE